MSVAYGGGLMSASALLFAFAYGQYRRPHPSIWTKSDFVTVTLTLSIIGLMSFGVAFVILGLFSLGEESPWLQDIAAVGAGLALCWVLVPRLMAPARLAEAPASVADLPEPANDPHPRSPSHLGGRHGKGSRRRAA